MELILRWLFFNEKKNVKIKLADSGFLEDYKDLKF